MMIESPGEIDRHFQEGLFAKDSPAHGFLASDE